MPMSEVEWMDDFGTNLLCIMHEFRINQKDLAEMSGLSEATISRYTNKTKMPSVRAILKLSYALDVDIEDLIDFGDTIE